MATETAPPPSASGADAPKAVSFLSSDVPIQAVTVFCKDKAEVTRVINFSSPSSLGRHEVELADLPHRFLINETSVRVKGSGHCTILHVSYTDEPPVGPAEPELTQEEEDAAKDREEKRKQDIQRLTDELTVLNQQSSRNMHMREYADRFAERAVTATAGGSTNAAAALGVSDNGPAPRVEDVGKALDWWAARAVQTDAEVHRLELEGRRLKEAITELHKRPATSSASARVPKATEKVTKKPGRILITVDVQDIGNIELEVKYMTRGATWSPSYDLRVDTQTDSVSCTYYGMVTQSTTEDWQGVSLRLSTAEPTVHGTPPALESKTVSLKTYRMPEPSFNKPRGVMKGMRKKSGASSRRSSFGSVGECEEDGESSSLDDTMSAALCVGGYGGGAPGGGGGGPAPCAPPPPPKAKPAVAQVEGGGGGMGAVSFVVETPADIKSNAQAKKLTVGVLQLSAEVSHYLVPAKESAAYLQAKATNNTDYLLLASNDVSIFFDNSFVTKTSLTSVSPGESFQTFLGIDPAVKITVAPPRKTSKKRGIFSKSNHVTHTHSTSISNKKKVPVTCVVVDAMPRSTNEIIKASLLSFTGYRCNSRPCSVTLKQPPPSGVTESEAITDDVLASAALEMCEAGDRGSSNVQTPPAVHGVLGVIKSPSNHLAWVGKIAPQGEISVPLEYTVEWPTGKQIEFSE
ncbi:unnamed protein product [Ectocarpus sp. 6 AP-2014]